jgi:hypothetical protein
MTGGLTPNWKEYWQGLGTLRNTSGDLALALVRIRRGSDHGGRDGVNNGDVLRVRGSLVAVVQSALGSGCSCWSKSRVGLSRSW